MFLARVADALHGRASELPLVGLFDIGTDDVRGELAIHRSCACVVPLVEHRQHELF